MGVVTVVHFLLSGWNLELVRSGPSVIMPRPISRLDLLSWAAYEGLV